MCLFVLQASNISLHSTPLSIHSSICSPLALYFQALHFNAWLTDLIMDTTYTGKDRPTTFLLHSYRALSSPHHIVPTNPSLLLLLLQLLLQHVTSSQDRSHFLRHVKGRSQTTHIFSGKLALLIFFPLLEPFSFDLDLFPPRLPKRRVVKFTWRRECGCGWGLFILEGEERILRLLLGRPRMIKPCAPLAMEDARRRRVDVLMLY